MSGASTRVGVGTRFVYDGEAVEVIELAATTAGNEVVLKDVRGRVQRLSLKELLFSDRASVIPDGTGPAGGDTDELASVVLDQLGDDEREATAERAGHMREVLTGFRSGSPELAADAEPRDEYASAVPLEARKAAKAEELGVTVRTIERWLAAFREHGEAGLAPRRGQAGGPAASADQRWVETALEVMVEHTNSSRPSRTLVIERTRARVIARFGTGVVPQPSRATAFRILEDLEGRHPLFRLSTKRNRDIAGRPEGPYGKLRPTRPGEYLLMDSTRLDVFAFDPLTLRWVQAELSVGMDWYTRCITGVQGDAGFDQGRGCRDGALRIFPASAVQRATGRAARSGPSTASRAPHWSMLLSRGSGLASPPIAPETLVVDHGKVYISDHLSSVCQRMGISVQPARLRTGRDKGPVERFFRTLREDLLQALPGYKGPGHPLPRRERGG